MTQEIIRPVDPENYISNESNPFKKISRTNRVIMGVGLGITMGCLINGIYKRPFGGNAHLHVFWAAALGTLLYKSYDFNDYIVKRDIYTLSIHQQRVKEQELLKKGKI
ncbi:hypothetical protein RB653_010272 [Dictyostelium firmibasis]|uniref:Uncharacterized protein n=1 Tax=Dictyostelium firmibasis TaxID=79012 RepID=A0AAN7YTJ1_9MYCE